MKYNKEYIKQIGLILTGFLLIGIGYFNYSFDDKQNKTLEVASAPKEEISEARNEINLGDVQLVNADAIVSNSAIVSNEELNMEEIDSEKSNSVEKLEEQNNYFEETRLDRDRMYSEMLETYQKLIDSSETPQDQKAIAAGEISNITKIKNGIMISENLIKNKGFEDVVILVNDNVVSVVVKSYTLNKEEISKIQNIIERELNVEIKNINISNKY
ncbi:MAG: SpoIIIAH-like family protein [Clostridia bacterium]|nr:SpoIIIAH-like family protein [Clostridia bacterium]